MTTQRACNECDSPRPWGTCNADGKMNGPCINCGRVPIPPFEGWEDMHWKAKLQCIRDCKDEPTLRAIIASASWDTLREAATARLKALLNDPLNRCVEAFRTGLLYAALDKVRNECG